MARPELASAYRNATAQRINLNGSREANGNVVIPGIFEVKINQEQVERYRKHSNLTLHLPVDDFAKVAFLIDLGTLIVHEKIQKAWLNRGSQDLEIHLANRNHQKTPEEAVTFDGERDLEGLYILTTSPSRDDTPAPYNVKLVPLYKREPIASSE